MFKKTCSAIAISLVLASMSGTASAGSTNTTLTVSATVQGTCSASIAPMNFGSFVQGQAPSLQQIQTPLLVNCVSGTYWTATADVGTGSGATFLNRLMTNATPGGGTLNYSLFASAGMVLPWGDGTNASSKLGPIMGTGTTQSNNIYGVLNSASVMVAAAGTYSDNVNITVSF
jgi:spore coat protein U-like protein